MRQWVVALRRDSEITVPPLQFQFKGEREGHVVKVIHDGEEQTIDIHSVVVGDVLLFAGEIIPYNNIVLSGHNVRCDDSGATGESYLVIAVGPKKFKGRSIMGASFIPLAFMSLLRQ